MNEIFHKKLQSESYKELDKNVCVECEKKMIEKIDRYFCNNCKIEVMK